MKSYLSKIITLSIFILMLCFPRQTFDGASMGLLLWFNRVLPTLLPFIILSNLLIRTQAADLIAKFTGPLLGCFFGVSSYGSFVIVAGFLCGYPMGSKVISDLIREGKLSLSEGRYLLSFCNNASPAFIVSYVVLQQLGQENFLLPALAILISAPILSSFLFRLRDSRQAVPVSCRSAGKSSRTPDKTAEAAAFDKGGMLDFCIMNGFETITKVGGYIMLFSIFLAIAGTFHISNPVFQFIILPSLEVTSGIEILCSSALLPAHCFFLCMICTSFGGLCAAAQTKCMIAGTGLTIRSYIIEKLITTLVTSLLSILYLQFLY